MPFYAGVACNPLEILICQASASMRYYIERATRLGKARLRRFTARPQQYAVAIIADTFIRRINVSFDSASAVSYRPMHRDTG